MFVLDVNRLLNICFALLEVVVFQKAVLQPVLLQHHGGQSCRAIVDLKLVNILSHANYIKKIVQILGLVDQLWANSSGCISFSGPFACAQLWFHFLCTFCHLYFECK